VAVLPELTKNDVRCLATDRSFGRGEDYYHSGAVFDAQRRGNTLTARIEGSQYDPYRVTVTLDPAGVQDTYCTCSYDWVIRVSQEQAEGLINKVQTKYYVPAVRWLEKVRAAYLAAGREAEWRAYLADLRQRHHRKRTLMRMLEGIK
jgi:uncharacterized Zn finger protein